MVQAVWNSQRENGAKEKSEGDKSNQNILFGEVNFVLLENLKEAEI